MSPRGRWWLLAWLQMVVACGGARGEQIGSACLSDTDCAAGVCEARVCSDTNGAGASARLIGTVVGKVEGAPESTQLIVREGEERCAFESGALVCKLALGQPLALVAPELPEHRFIAWTGSPACRGTLRELNLTTGAAGAECTARYVQRLRVTGVIADVAGASVQASSESERSECGLGTCTVDRGAWVTLTAPERDGYRIVGFEGTGCEQRDGYRVRVQTSASDVLCTARYAASVTARGKLQGVHNEDSAVQNPSVVASSASATALCQGPLCAVNLGESVTLVAPTIDGYRFRGWIGQPECTSSDPVLQLAALSSTVVCTADYVRRFRVTGESAGVMAPITALADSGFPSCAGPSCLVDEGTTVTLLAGTAPGYRLDGFSGEGCEASSGSSAQAREVQQDRRCVATYVAGVAVSGTVVNADAEVSATSTFVDAHCAAGRCALDLGGSVTLTAPDLPGRTFVGWSGDPGCIGAALAITLERVVDSKDCLATFSPRYRAQGRAAPATGGAVAASATSGNPSCDEQGCEVDEGSAVTLVAVPRDNFRFGGWNGGGACSGSSQRLELSDLRGSVACNANFVPRVQVSTEVTPAGAATVHASSLSPGAQCAGGACSVDAGSGVLLRADEAAGFRFSQWLGCGDASSPLSRGNPLLISAASSDTRCTAVLERVSYPLSADSSAGGTATVRSGSCAGPLCVVEHGASATFSARSEAGQRFAGWSGDCSGSQAELSVQPVQAAMRCTASFEPIALTVAGVLNLSGAGTIAARSTSAGAQCSAASCTVRYGGAVTLEASESAGFRFVGFGGCTGEVAGRTITLAQIASDQTCTANYEPMRYLVTALADPPGAARLSCEAGCIASHGESVTLSVVDSGAYRLRGWSGDGCPTSSEASVTVAAVDAPRTCVAQFVRQHTLTVNTNGSGAASCGDGGQQCLVDEGSSVPIVATIPVGLYFERWSGCAVAEPTNQATTVAVGADVVCTANFAIIAL